MARTQFDRRNARWEHPFYIVQSVDNLYLGADLQSKCNKVKLTHRTSGKMGLNKEIQ